MRTDPASLLNGCISQQQKTDRNRMYEKCLVKKEMELKLAWVAVKQQAKECRE